MSKFLHDDYDDAKAIALPQVSAENSRAKNAGDQNYLYPQCFQKVLFLKVVQNKKFCTLEQA